MSDVGAEELLSRAEAAFGEGRIADALDDINAAIALEPTSTPAYFQLGAAHHAAGDLAAAATAFRHAAELSPGTAEIHFNLASVLAQAGDDDEACASFVAARQCAPDWFDPWLAEGATLSRCGHNVEAVIPLRRAVELDPGNWNAHFHLGNALLYSHDNQGACETLAEAARLAGPVAEVENNLGRALELSGRDDEALAAYIRAREAGPDHFRSAVNLGNLYTRTGDGAAAEPIFRAAIEMRPDDVDGHAGLGNLLHYQSLHEEATVHLSRAVEIDPGDRASMNHLAFSLSLIGEYNKAYAWYTKLLELRPDDGPVYVNFANMLEMLDRSDEAMQVLQIAARRAPDFAPIYPMLAHSMLRQCNWDNINALIVRVIDDAKQEMVRKALLPAPPFVLLALPVPMDIRLEASRQAAQAASERATGAYSRNRYRHQPRPAAEKIRIGYLSPDFRGHSVGVTLRDLIAAHDRERFEIIGYHIARKNEDEHTEFYRRTFDRFVDLREFSHARSAQQIYDDKVDILIDLAGHTGNARMEVLALKPAPVQVHFMGYGATIGADYIDYLITDDGVMPPEDAQYCDESLVYMPHTFMPATRHDFPQIVAKRADHGLPEEGFVFANFNWHYKFDPEIFSIWMRLLRRAPGSVLWMAHGTEQTARNLRREAEARGVAPERLIFAPRCDQKSHLARHALADLGLDNYYHAGGVTTIDALWAGLPVLTMRGPYPNSRTGVGILEAAGLPELIAENQDEYGRIATELTTDPQRLNALRARLKATRETCHLFDMSHFARHLEAAFAEMWSTFQAGEAPHDIRT